MLKFGVDEALEVIWTDLHFVGKEMESQGEKERAQDHVLISGASARSTSTQEWKDVISSFSKTDCAKNLSTKFQCVLDHGWSGSKYRPY